MSGSLGIDRLSLGEARFFDKNISQILHDWFGGIPVHTWGYGGSMGRYLKTYKKSLFGLTELTPPDSIGDVDIVVCFPSEDLKKKALKNLGERVGYQKNGKPRRRFEWVTYNKNKQVRKIQIVEGCQDELSLIYFFRHYQLTIGETYTFPFLTQDKIRNIACQISRGTIKSKLLGKVDALVITSDRYKIWLTNDERRIPIRIEAKVKVGKFVGSLIRIESLSPTPYQ